jgi:hypothetical protein
MSEAVASVLPDLAFMGGTRAMTTTPIIGDPVEP